MIHTPRAPALNSRRSLIMPRIHTDNIRLVFFEIPFGFYKEKWHAFRPKLNASLQTLHTIESLKDERTSFKLDGFSFSCEQ